VHDAGRRRGTVAARGVVLVAPAVWRQARGRASWPPTGRAAEALVDAQKTWRRCSTGRGRARGPDRRGRGTPRPGRRRAAVRGAGAGPRDVLPAARRAVVGATRPVNAASAPTGSRRSRSGGVDQQAPRAPPTLAVPERAGRLIRAIHTLSGVDCPIRLDNFRRAAAAPAVTSSPYVYEARAAIDATLLKFRKT
jgi:hypothetical protein